MRDIDLRPHEWRRLDPLPILLIASVLISYFLTATMSTFFQALSG
jgi:hypothetical protein